VFQWIPYVGSHVVAKSDRTTLATLLVPVANLAEAEAIAQSVRLRNGDRSDLSVTFTRKGKKREFVFDKTKEGLVLKP
jgi:hypothetical protein